MITEDYVSFEIAKLLKESDFRVCTKSFYKKTSGIIHHNTCALGYYGDSTTLPAPTLQMVMKWLREVHNIHVVPKFDFYAGDYTGGIYDGRLESTAENDDYIAIVGNVTYEQACEAAIKYCLTNLI